MTYRRTDWHEEAIRRVSRLKRTRLKIVYICVCLSYFRDVSFLPAEQLSCEHLSFDLAGLLTSAEPDFTDNCAPLWWNGVVVMLETMGCYFSTVPSSTSRTMSLPSRWRQYKADFEEYQALLRDICSSRATAVFVASLLPRHVPTAPCLYCYFFVSWGRTNYSSDNSFNFIILKDVCIFFLFFFFKYCSLISPIVYKPM
jgi:hypothetical protein